MGRRLLRPAFRLAALETVRLASAGGGFSAEAEALFAAMTVQPDDTRKGIINDLIVSLMAAGVWTKLGVFYVMAAHDEQAARLNWKDPTGPALVNVGGSDVSFTADAGITGGNSLTTHLSSQINATAVSGFAQNNAHVALWRQTVNDTHDSNRWQGFGTGFTNLGVNLTGSFGNSAAAINGTSSQWLLGVANTDGHFVLSRDGATSAQGYRNATQVGTDSSTSSAVQANAIGFLAGIGLNKSRDTIASGSAGAALNSTEVTAYYNALNTYLSEVGAVYVAEAQALFAAMTVPPTLARKVLINGIIDDLMDAGLWDKLGVLYVHAAHDEQAGRLNWKNPAFGLLTRVQSMAFATDGGFTGNGQINANASYLEGPDFNTVPVLAQNSGHMSIFATSEGDGQAGGGFDARNFNEFPGGDNVGRITPKSVLAPSNGFAWINGSGQMTFASSSVVRGQYLVNRSGATAAQLYRDGVAGATDTTASAALVSSNFSIGASFVGFTWVSREPRIGATTIGGALTSDEAAALYAILSNYLSTVGAIP